MDASIGELNIRSRGFSHDPLFAKRTEMTIEALTSKQPKRSGLAIQTIDWTAALFDTLKAHDVRQVTYVPDAGHARLIEMCHAEPSMKPTVLTTEEEGIGVLAGAWLGGERGVLLMQSSGVGNCINTLSLARICNFPLLMIVTMRGEWGELNPWQVPMGQITEDSLKLAGTLTFRVTEQDAVASTVESAARIVFSGGFSAAVLLSQRLLGTKLFKD